METRGPLRRYHGPVWGNASALGSLYVINRILEDLDAERKFILDRLALALHQCLGACPIRVVGPVVEGLGVRHQTKDAAGGITYPCYVKD